MRHHWLLDPSIAFLNHGSFGACPRVVLEHQTELRTRLESEPVHFFLHELPPMLEQAREAVAAFVGARAEDLGFVRNATSGVNAVLRSLSFEPGDELLVTDHGYNACSNVADFVTRRAGARVAVARLPFPLHSEDEVVEAVLAAVTDRTRVALLDHVTSPTGLVLPLERLLPMLRERGVQTLVDGAHAPGMLELDLTALGATWYTANFHKHTCAPKGAAMLWAREDVQADLHPATISHGYNSKRLRKRWLEEIDWQGTDDPTSWLCVPRAIEFVGSLVEGGWPEIRARNRALVLRGREILCEALDVSAPAPESMIGTLAAVPLWPGEDAPPTSALYADPLQIALFEEDRIEVPIPPWPGPPQRLVRISAHLYNDEAEYRALARALVRRRPSA
ncbi:aminotransferase class V-fold PLP-dependent enzyme [Paraliomyxa miuraensis]|uniref:aminotransferase class V-fold PLP-dependent enzyme n=1 Tax=Paraliomyxa miuraensis TaxID=376150 RepID=UPI0022503A49|nr:aminotransferase class V-fold PLP-dependent enzyme [Paraliomyxa miuraensis]MCX4241153.1 aminotransferase class V-fold PLP-dependent enzyme [Paraliomyxa miuraensis]